MKQALLLIAALAATICLPEAFSANAGELIAYVTPSRGPGAIVVSAPDGSGIRTLFEPPTGTNASDAVERLAWSPDGRRLAFSSSHQWRQSVSFSDIYVISRDGRDLKRPTSSPDPSRYDDYPKGKVKVVIDNPSIHSAETIVSMEGAKKPVSFLGKQASRVTVEFDDVADFGDGVRQYVRVFRQPAGAFGDCWLDLGVFADVEPGKTVDAGKLSWSNKSNCMRSWQPTWINNERIAFLSVEFPWQPFPSNNVWSTSANIKPGERLTQRLLNMDTRTRSDKLSAIAAGPKIADGQELLLLESHGRMSTTVHSAPTDDVERLSNVNLGRCPRTFCLITGVDWRSDGNGLFVAEAQSAATGNPPRDVSILYEFDAASRSRRQILTLPNEIIGRITVSPDNKTIAFERASRLIDTIDNVRFGPRVQCPCSVWLVNADGSNLRKLAADGRAPAWTH